MPRRRPRPDLRPLLELQRGLVRRDQVIGTALTDAALRWLLDTGQWRAVLPSVFATFTGALSDEQRTGAAQLYCGPAGQLTGPAALRRFGFRYAPSDNRVHMLLPHNRHLRSTGFVVVQRTHRPDPEPREADMVRTVSVARAVADTVRECRDVRVVRAVVAESVQRRLTSVPQLEAELAEGPRRGSGTFRRVLAEVVDGVRSAPEAQLREICETTAVLPRVLWNPQLRAPDRRPVPIPDGWLADVGIALEVDSREHHLSAEDWQRTLRRHNVLTRYGALVLHFTPTEIYTAPETVRRTLVEAYLQRLRDGATNSLSVE